MGTCIDNFIESLQLHVQKFVNGGVREIREYDQTDKIWNIWFRLYCTLLSYYLNNKHSFKF